MVVVSGQFLEDHHTCIIQWKHCWLVSLTHQPTLRLTIVTCLFHFELWLSPVSEASPSWQAGRMVLRHSPLLYCHSRPVPSRAPVAKQLDNKDVTGTCSASLKEGAMNCQSQSRCNELPDKEVTYVKQAYMLRLGVQIQVAFTYINTQTCIMLQRYAYVFPVRPHCITIIKSCKENKMCRSSL